jgi:hypothetical protein
MHTTARGGGRERREKAKNKKRYQEITTTELSRLSKEEWAEIGNQTR